jgi:aconitate hydratase
MIDAFNSLKPFRSGRFEGSIYSLPTLEEAGLGAISRLPVSLRVVLESILRNCDGGRITEEDVKTLAGWRAGAPAAVEIPFVVSRIVLQDFTGVPLLVDLAAMRDAVQAVGGDPTVIEPLVPVDLVVDHSVQVDRSGTATAFEDNLRIEFERNRERYQFLKWGQEAFDTFCVVPPSIGIVHQVNLEYLAKVVFDSEVDGKRIFYPDTVVGTDSHTTMINGLGVVGWGVGGIEAEAGMLGQPVYFLTPEVIGVHLRGSLAQGVTATDMTLRITEILRSERVVGKFVEFYGEGAARLTLADRATVANMAPEYGATMGFFPIDEKAIDYLRMTGRSEDHLGLVKDYFQAQGMFGIPREGDVDYTKTLELDLNTVVPSVAGPKRPQDRIDLFNLKSEFRELLGKSVKEGGYGLAEEAFGRSAVVRRAASGGGGGVAVEEPRIGNGSVLIAAITSCTNTSNPSVMVAAGLVAKKAVAKGLKIDPTVKTSLAPGSRVVTDYLKGTGLQDPLDALGFNLVGYGCTTCIGNSGPLDPAVEAAISEGNLVGASVLSGNRNFEARVHSSVKANFLMSPPLVVVLALAGRVDIDLENEALGDDGDGNPVFMRDIWPTHEEIQAEIVRGIRPEMFNECYADVVNANPEWSAIESTKETLYQWDEESTYIQSPPFFDGFSMQPGKIEEIRGMRPLAIVGDSVTTDHISPAGAIPKDSPAGIFLESRGVASADFNSFGSRRGNDKVMTRGTFGNVRFRNLMADGREGGWTKFMPEGELMPIFDACREYAMRGAPLIVFTGNDYGMGSSRDWAAKGAALLGVRVVVASSFERIHRSNLIGMGVLPLQFPAGCSHQSLNLDGSETYSLLGIDDDLKPAQEAVLEITRADRTVDSVALTTRIDTPIEVEYYRHGGILQFVLRSLLKRSD